MRSTFGYQAGHLVFKLCVLLSTVSTCVGVTSSGPTAASSGTTTTTNINSTTTTTTSSTTQPPADFSIRLVRGYSASSGRVQIFDGEAWGKICLPRFKWTRKEAMVTCRQLGYPSALSSWEILDDYSRDRVATKNVSCIGNETSLTECVYEPSKTHYCGPGFPNMYEALVVCQPNQGDTQPSYLLELFHGKDDTEGSVQLRPFESPWIICSALLDTKDATVICRELGYEYATEVFTDNHFFTDLDSFSTSLRFLGCAGNEQYLLECPHTISQARFCQSVGGVKCSVEPSRLPGEEIRLAGSPDVDEGHLQTFYNGQWWNICNDGLWSEREANVTCRSLGYSTGWPLYTLRYSQEYKDTASGDALITGFKCQGTESNLRQCLFDVSHSTKCGFYNIAAVHCSSTSLVNPTVPYGVKIRLANGGSLTSGQVEVYHDDQWWSVCSLSGWDRHAATVVCHQLGFVGAIPTDTYVTVPARGAARSDKGILYSSVECTGQEQRLDQCKVSMETSECTHDDDVYLKCFEAVYEDEGVYTTAVPVTTGGPTAGEGLTLNAGGVYQASEGPGETAETIPGEVDTPAGITVPVIVIIMLICVLLCIIVLIVIWRVIKARNSRAAGAAQPPGVSWSRDRQQSYQPVPGQTEGGAESPKPVDV